MFDWNEALETWFDKLLAPWAYLCSTSLSKCPLNTDTQTNLWYLDHLVISTRFCVLISDMSTVRVLTDEHTHTEAHTQTDWTIFISLTTDAGGKMLYISSKIHSFLCACVFTKIRICLFITGSSSQMVFVLIFAKLFITR